MLMSWTTQNFVLVENENVALYEDCESLCHVINLRNCCEIVGETRKLFEGKVSVNLLDAKHPDNLYNPSQGIIEIYLQFNIIETLLEQLQNEQRKRISFNELGTIFKFITVTSELTGLESRLSSTSS